MNTQKIVIIKYTIISQLHYQSRQHELDTDVRANQTRKTRSNHPDDTLFQIF